MINIYAALEIGTSKTVLAIGEAPTGQKLKLSCWAEIPSSGVRKSQILDISQAAQSVRSVIREIEKKQLAKGDSITIGNAFLVVNGQHIKADPFQGSVPIARRTVSSEDIEEVQQSATTMPLPRDRERLDIVERAYSIDDFGGVADPKGMAGRILKLDTFHIHAEANRINDARTAAGEAHLELRDPLFAVTCAADAVLDETEKRDGCMVIDCGGGSTGWAIYSDNGLVATGVIGVGGDHITNDIATAFQTTQAQAEDLKTREASAIVGATGEDASPRVHLAGFSTMMDQRTISRHALNTVVNSRCREIVDILREALEEADMQHRLHSGIILTGGGAAMRGLNELLKRELGANVRFGVPNIGGLEDENHTERFAAISGALLYAHRNYEQKSFLQTLFGGFRK